MTPTTLLWILFWAIFVGVSAADYFLHNKGTIDVKAALRWTTLWIAIGLGFSGLIYWLHPNGAELSTEYISGWLTEYSLSVDNLFIFILIFSFMGVQEAAQPKLIKLGIYLSIVLRIVFILFGMALINRFHGLIYGFGALLIWTAWKMVSTGSEDSVHPEKNLLHKLASRFLPIHNDDQVNNRLFSRWEGKRCVTPLFLVFLVIGSTDVLFAIDSIPAIMGISQDSFVVLSSNVFAVLGLNSLFFAIRGVMGMFKFLKHGVSIILFFIGAKMIAGIYHPIEAWFKANSFVPLLVIINVLAASIVTSVWHDRSLKKKLPADDKKPEYEL